VLALLRTQSVRPDSSAVLRTQSVRLASICPLNCGKYIEDDTDLQWQGVWVHPGISLDRNAKRLQGHHLTEGYWTNLGGVGEGLCGLLSSVTKGEAFDEALRPDEDDEEDDPGKAWRSIHDDGDDSDGPPSDEEWGFEAHNVVGRASMAQCEDSDDDLPGLSSFPILSHRRMGPDGHLYSRAQAAAICDPTTPCWSFEEAKRHLASVEYRPVDPPPSPLMRSAPMRLCYPRCQFLRHFQDLGCSKAEAQSRWDAAKEQRFHRPLPIKQINNAAVLEALLEEVDIPPIAKHTKKGLAHRLEEFDSFCCGESSYTLPAWLSRKLEFEGHRPMTLFQKGITADCELKLKDGNLRDYCVEKINELLPRGSFKYRPERNPGKVQHRFSQTDLKVLLYSPTNNPTPRWCISAWGSLCRAQAIEAFGKTVAEINAIHTREGHLSPHSRVELDLDCFRVSHTLFFTRCHHTVNARSLFMAVQANMSSFEEVSLSTDEGMQKTQNRVFVKITPRRTAQSPAQATVQIFATGTIMVRVRTCAPGASVSEREAFDTAVAAVTLLWPYIDGHLGSSRRCPSCRTACFTCY